MKILKTKSEITAKTLKSSDCDYKGNRIGYDETEGCYFIGSHFNSGVNFFDTVENLKIYGLPC